VSKVTWVEGQNLFPTAVSKLEHTDVVIDIGCGIKPQSFIKPSIHICCEPFDRYVTHLQKHFGHDRRYIIIKATWAEAVRIFPPKSVDTVFLIDVVEHLVKEEGISLIKPTENLARRQVAVFTPLGFFPQEHPDGKDAWGLDGGEWQTHRSGWYPEDFDDSWAVYAAKAFHIVDNMNRPLEQPFGAFWAIKTFTNEHP
jgi:hypothetical protein